MPKSRYLRDFCCLDPKVDGKAAKIFRGLPSRREDGAGAETETHPHAPAAESGRCFGEILLPITVILK
jgi:hypothetical protein